MQRKRNKPAEDFGRSTRTQFELEETGANEILLDEIRYQMDMMTSKNATTQSVASSLSNLMDIFLKPMQLGLRDVICSSIRETLQIIGAVVERESDLQVERNALGLVLAICTNSDGSVDASLLLPIESILRTSGFGAQPLMSCLCAHTCETMSTHSRSPAPSASAASPASIASRASASAPPTPASPALPQPPQTDQIGHHRKRKFAGAITAKCAPTMGSSPESTFSAGNTSPMSQCYFDVADGQTNRTQKQVPQIPQTTPQGPSQTHVVSSRFPSLYQTFLCASHGADTGAEWLVQETQMLRLVVLNRYLTCKVQSLASINTDMFKVATGSEEDEQKESDEAGTPSEQESKGTDSTKTANYHSQAQSLISFQATLLKRSKRDLYVASMARQLGADAAALSTHLRNRRLADAGVGGMGVGGDVGGEASCHSSGVYTRMWLLIGTLDAACFRCSDMQTFLSALPVKHGRRETSLPVLLTCILLASTPRLVLLRDSPNECKGQENGSNGKGNGDTGTGTGKVGVLGGGRVQVQAQALRESWFGRSPSKSQSGSPRASHSLSQQSLHSHTSHTSHTSTHSTPAKTLRPLSLTMSSLQPSMQRFHHMFPEIPVTVSGPLEETTPQHTPDQTHHMGTQHTHAGCATVGERELCTVALKALISLTNDCQQGAAAVLDAYTDAVPWAVAMLVWCAAWRCAFVSRRAGEADSGALSPHETAFERFVFDTTLYVQSLLTNLAEFDAEPVDMDVLTALSAHRAISQALPPGPQEHILRHSPLLRHILTAPKVPASPQSKSPSTKSNQSTHSHSSSSSSSTPAPIPSKLRHLLVDVLRLETCSFLQDFEDTDCAINEAQNPTGGPKSIKSPTESQKDKSPEARKSKSPSGEARPKKDDSSLPVAELILSAHAALLLHTLTRNGGSDVRGMLPRQNWWLCIRILKAFLSLQGQTGIMLLENISPALLAVREMSSEDERLSPESKRLAQGAAASAAATVRAITAPAATATVRVTAAASSTVGAGYEDLCMGESEMSQVRSEVSEVHSEVHSAVRSSSWWLDTHAHTYTHTTSTTNTTNTTNTVVGTQAQAQEFSSPIMRHPPKSGKWVWDGNDYKWEALESPVVPVVPVGISQPVEPEKQQQQQQHQQHQQQQHQQQQQQSQQQQSQQQQQQPPPQQQQEQKEEAEEDESYPYFGTGTEQESSEDVGTQDEGTQGEDPTGLGGLGLESESRGLTQSGVTPTSTSRGGAQSRSRSVSPRAVFPRPSSASSRSGGGGSPRSSKKQKQEDSTLGELISRTDTGSAKGWRGRRKITSR